MKAFSIKQLVDITGGTLLNGDDSLPISSFSTSSKDGDKTTLFVPVIGEHVDAHDYIKDAMNHGMRAVFTSRDRIEPGTELMTYIYVPHTVTALQRIAIYYRRQFELPIIGITGSVGKTTTKEMVAAALEGQSGDSLKILKTIGNKNSQIGLAQMMFLIEKHHQIAVIEMGMSMSGEMDRLSKIAKPSCAIFTNIGVSHIGQLGSKENIRKEKMNIINDFPKGGFLILNGDDPLLLELYHYIKQIQNQEEVSAIVDLSEKTKEKLKDIHVCTYGTGLNLDYQGKEIKIIDGETHFVYCNHVKDDAKEEKIVLPVLGSHNVLNALAALAAAEYFKVSVSSAKEGLRTYRPIAMRGVVEICNGITIIDDTYNASPDSMRSGIEILSTLSNVNRRIAVLADILELGEVSEKCHREVGVYIAESKTDILITIGSEARYIAEEAVHRTKNRIILVRSFATKEEAILALKETIRKGDAILVKGSRGMELENIVKVLRE